MSLLKVVSLVFLAFVLNGAVNGFGRMPGGLSEEEKATEEIQQLANGVSCLSKSYFSLANACLGHLFSKASALRKSLYDTTLL